MVPLFFGQKGAPGAKRSWRGSLVSGERRHLMKKACSVLEQREDQEEKAIWSKMVVSEVLDTGIWSHGTG